MRYLNRIIILSEKHIKLAKQYILTNITKNYVKSGENEAKSENLAFSGVNYSLKAKSRQKSEYMAFKVNFLGF